MMERKQLEHNSFNFKSFKFADDILYRQVENEAVLLHIPSGMYYSLNETGVKFWEGIQTQSPEQVIEQIVSEYAVESSHVRQDLLAFLDDLASYGIVSWVNE